MKIFIDTANIDEIKSAVDLGIVSGVTTNPSLIAKEGRALESVLKEIDSIIPKDSVFFGEVNSLQADKMIEEARQLVKISPKLSVKIPMCREGLKAIAVLSGEGISTNCTLIFTPNQALLAARAGANYVSPFVGRLDDICASGLDVISDCAQIFKLHNIACEIISASIRTPIHVSESAKRGAHIATIPTRVLDQMIDHPLTSAGIDIFVSDWNAMQEKL